jgi:hypothetical protein
MIHKKDFCRHGAIVQDKASSVGQGMQDAVPCYTRSGASGQWVAKELAFTATRTIVAFEMLAN